MTVDIMVGDARAVLEMLPDGFVQCVVTSPPYFGLRDYGVPGQIGLEATPDEYVANLVAAFREVRRVLADDGTLWVVVGDSYSVQHIGRRDHGAGEKTSRLGPKRDGIPGGTAIKASANRLVAGMKPKDLLMIPARVALALQADGWYLRSQIIWHKPNPMPESVTDRPTCAHESVFLLTKRPRYFYDHEAIKEAPTYSPATGTKAGAKRERNVGGRTDGFTRLAAAGGVGCPVGGRNARNVWTITPKPFPGAHHAVMPPALAERCVMAGSRPGDTVLDPFFGAGTTGLVADRLGRSCIGIELNERYAALARDRLGLAEESAVAAE
jgi:DNA modification methylase